MISLIQDHTHLSTLFDHCSQMLCSWVWPVGMDMLVQVLDSSCVRVDDLLHILRTHFVLHPRACACHQALGLELVGI